MSLFLDLRIQGNGLQKHRNQEYTKFQILTEFLSKIFQNLTIYIAFIFHFLKNLTQFKHPHQDDAILITRNVFGFSGRVDDIN